MKTDLYASTGKKKGTVDLPSVLFEAKINEGLMHFAFLMQQSNRRQPIAHVKTRGEVRGSTRKLFKQKGTGRARRGSIRAPILRGGGRAFGPRNTRNFTKDMPKKMRRKALLSCLSHAAKEGRILALESYDDDHKTKTFVNLLSTLPVNPGRKIVFVIPERTDSTGPTSSRKLEALEHGANNVPGVKMLPVNYLNPEDILGAHHIVFLVDALKRAEEVFGGKSVEEEKAKETRKPVKSKSVSAATSSTSKTKSINSKASSKKSK